MMKKSALVLLSALALGACSSAAPRVIQASTNASDLHLTVGMASQIEMPDAGRVQSVVVGNPSLVTVDQAGDVVNLIGKGGEGETNLIIRSRDDSGHVKVYQYRVIVQEK